MQRSHQTVGVVFSQCPLCPSSFMQQNTDMFEWQGTTMLKVPVIGDGNCAFRFLASRCFSISRLFCWNSQGMRAFFARSWIYWTIHAWSPVKCSRGGPGTCPQSATVVPGSRSRGTRAARWWRSAFECSGNPAAASWHTEARRRGNRAALQDRGHRLLDLPAQHRAIVSCGTCTTAESRPAPAAAEPASPTHAPAVYAR